MRRTEKSIKCHWPTSRPLENKTHDSKYDSFVMVQTSSFSFCIDIISNVQIVCRQYALLDHFYDNYSTVHWMIFASGQEAYMWFYLNLWIITLFLFNLILEIEKKMILLRSNECLPSKTNDGQICDPPNRVSWHSKREQERMRAAGHKR